MVTSWKAEEGRTARPKKKEKVLSETDKLQLENKKMERRLEELKKMLEEDKQRRAQSGGTFWKRGKEGPIHSHTKKVMKQLKDKNDQLLNKKTFRVLRRPEQKAPEHVNKGLSKERQRVLFESSFIEKTLRDELENGRNAQGGELDEEEKKIMNETPMWKIPIALQGEDNGSDGATDTQSREDRSCGQCEDRRAVLFCKECSEEYCNECFASFHKKGALKLHNCEAIYVASTVTTGPGNVQEVDRSMISQNSLGNFDGTYEEDASHKWFLEGLEEWRRGCNKEESNGKNKSFEIQTEATSSNKPHNVSVITAQIKFSSSMRYIDKLLLKRFRENPEFYVKASDKHLTNGPNTQHEGSSPIGAFERETAICSNSETLNFQEMLDGSQKTREKDSLGQPAVIVSDEENDSLEEAECSSANEDYNGETDDSLDKAPPNHEELVTSLDQQTIRESSVSVDASSASLSSYTQKVGALLSDFDEVERIVYSGTN
eukprot:Nk52_evm10s78 gene=Nk52_evmTU10s78